MVGLETRLTPEDTTPSISLYCPNRSTRNASMVSNHCCISGHDKAFNSKTCPASMSITSDYAEIAFGDSSFLLVNYYR
jgi:hypothetical protein